MEFESDDILVGIVERGGSAGGRAVAVLFRRHLPKIYSLCRRYFVAREDAEEASSETFVRSFRALSNGQFRGDAQYRTWLLRIAANTCMERLRQPRLPTLSLEGLSGTRDEPVADDHQSNGSIRVQEAVRLLPDDQSLAIMLCDIEGYTAKEAAEIMSRSPEAMKSLHYRARRALRDMLIEWQKSEE